MFFAELIAFVETRYAGSKAIIDEAQTIITDQKELFYAILTALEKYVPGSTPFLEILRGLIGELVTKQMASQAE